MPPPRQEWSRNNFSKSSNTDYEAKTDDLHTGVVGLLNPTGVSWYATAMSNATVLIVEDDENLRALYADAFEIAGISVLTASDGAQGVTLALTHRPDAILMDIMMPVMDGHQAVAKIREDSWGKKAIVIFLTNMTDAENVVHAIEKGSSKYIIKSDVPPKEVVNQVRMAMRA